MDDPIGVSAPTWVVGTKIQAVAIKVHNSTPPTVDENLLISLATIVISSFFMCPLTPSSFQRSFYAS